MTHSGPIVCVCCAHTPNPVDVEVHHIWPRADGGPDTAANRVAICPTGHSSTHWLLRRYKRDNGTPPWEDRRKLNPYLRSLAARGWLAMQTGTVQ